MEMNLNIVLCLPVKWVKLSMQSSHRFNSSDPMIFFHQTQHLFCSTNNHSFFCKFKKINEYLKMLQIDYFYQQKKVCINLEKKWQQFIRLISYY